MLVMYSVVSYRCVVMIHSQLVSIVFLFHMYVLRIVIPYHNDSVVHYIYVLIPLIVDWSYSIVFLSLYTVISENLIHLSYHVMFCFFLLLVFLIPRPGVSIPLSYVSVFLILYYT